MDIGKIQQCVMNMIINAKDAMAGGGTLDVSTAFRAETDEIVLEIHDTGVGIPPENLSRIFDPFFTTKEAKGLGLGLSVAYGIVHEHGGDIEVESEVGRGTTFRVRLPLHPEKAVGRQRPDAKD
jgi:signal transduction histidine kinase